MENRLFNYIKKNTGLHKAGFTGICFMGALILAACLYKHFYTAGISDVFNLSMDILGSMVCIMLYYGCLCSGSTRNDGSVLFFSLLFVTVLTLFFDVFMWFIDGVCGLRLLNILVSVLFYAGADLLLYIFWRYACFILKPENERGNRLDKLSRIMLCLSLILCFLNLFIPVLFLIDHESVFHRAPGYPAGSLYILATFLMLISLVCKADIEAWRKLFTVILAIVSIAAFPVTWNLPQFAVSYTVSIIAVIITGCVLYVERIRMKELVIRIFSVLLLCAMLIYGPAIYVISSEEAVNDGYETVNKVFSLVTVLLDEVGFEKLNDPANTGLYQNTREKLREVCRAFELQNVYVETIDPKEQKRAFVIAVAASDEEDLIVKETLGWPGASVWSETSYLTEPELSALKGEYPETYSEQDNTYGHNLDWFYPYKDADGRVIALIGADIDAAKQQTETIRKSLADIAPVIVVFFLTLIILILMLDHVFIEPFYTIARHIQSFFMEGNRKGQSLTVKGGYETWFLLKSFDFMTSELDEYEEVRAREIRERQRITTELELASRIQSHFLPNVFPPFPGRTEFGIFASMKPAREIGGDFYDFFFIDEDHLALVVADVSGKSVPAALFMMIAKVILRTGAQIGLDPVRILEEANEQLTADNAYNMFVTVWLGILEISSGRLTFADAGHEKLLLLSEGKWEAVPKKTGRPLGLFSEKGKTSDASEKASGFMSQSIILKPGDAVFQYTDGIVEALNANDDFFGDDRLLETLNSFPASDPETVIGNVRENIEEFTADMPQFDDMTMLCLIYYGN